MPNGGLVHDFWDLARLGWLGEKSEDFQSAIHENARVKHYTAGEFLHHIGDAQGGIYGLVDGSVGTYTLSDASGILLAHIFREGAWFGQGPALTGKPRYLAFKAMEPSTILHMSPSAIAKTTHSFPGAERELASLSEYNQTIMARALSDLLIRKSEARVASVLLRLFEITLDGSRLARVCKLTQSELSEMTNTSRHTANTVLKSFEANGWLEISYGHITLKDPEALRRRANA